MPEREPPSPPTEPASPAGAGLGPTRWTMIGGAQNKSTTALNQLFSSYRQPLLDYLERRVKSLQHLQVRGRPLGEAEDLLQEFFAALLRRDFLRNVSAGKGRFRTFILRSLDHFLADKIDGVLAKRGGGSFEHESTNQPDESGNAPEEPRSVTPTPDVEFDRAMATLMLAKAVDGLREEYRHRGRLAVFQALEPVLFQDENAPPYRELGQRLGMEPPALRTAASRMRSELAESIREEIRKTLADGEDEDEEFGHLFRVLAR